VFIRNEVSGKEIHMTFDEIDHYKKRFMDEGLGLFSHPRTTNAIYLSMRDRAVQTAYVQWLVGISTVNVGKTMSTDPENVLIRKIDEFPLIEELSKIDGMVSVVIVPYLMEVTKADSFTWEEMVPNVIDAWKTYQLKKEFVKHEG
jgi:Scaffold protein Nfu/NifU N terminal